MGKIVNYMKPGDRVYYEEKGVCVFGTLSDKIYYGANGIVIRYIDFITKIDHPHILNFKACGQEELKLCK